MEVNDFVSRIIDTAESFGLKYENDAKKKNATKRNRLEAPIDAPYFAFVGPEEGESGLYKDLSLVFFPSMDGGSTKGDKYFMNICVGSEGFRDDYELASRPGTRRLFTKLLPSEKEYAPYFKSDFTNIENCDASDFDEKIEEKGINLDKYKNFIMIGCLVDPDADMELIGAWIAQYAEIRNWPTNKGSKDKVRKALANCPQKYFPKEENDEDKVKKLLEKRHYVVLQGAPGCGKTYLAEKIADEGGFVKKMIQFHAETSYSDFVEGIKPDLNADILRYSPVKGTLVEAMEYAADHPTEKVLLIIDEINRANLANVLGPVFYLFEYSRKADEPFSKEDNGGIKLGKYYWNVVPDNLYVIATMNTADRSIAVVDFALRRRFAWHTIAPQYFESEGCVEAKRLFKDIERIFERYASDEEMDLMPGGSYFMAKDKEELNLKIEYELMPLIKEYLNQGLLKSATDALSNLFYNHVKKSLFK